MKKTIAYRLDRSRLSVFDSTKYPVKRAKNGIPYMDVPGLGFYAGIHKGLRYTSKQIAQLEANFPAPDPRDELDGPIPVMIDHSESNRNKCGHFRSVKTIGNESHVVFRIVGEEAIKSVMEGKFRSLSAGISFSEDPDASNEPDPMDPKEPQEGEGYAEGDPIKTECAEEAEPEGAYEDIPKNVTCSYDHMAFTPFPALVDCKLYQRDPVLETAVHNLKKETKKLSEAEEPTPQKIMSEREKFSRMATESLVKAGKVAPAHKAFFSSFVSTLDSDQRDCFLEYMENHAPTAVPWLGEAKAFAVSVRPEEDRPIAAAKSVEHSRTQSNVSRLKSLFTRGQSK